MATAKRLPSGNWRVRVFDSKTKKYLSFTASTKRQAEMDALLFTKRSAEPIKLQEAMERYIDMKEGVLSPSTVLGYRKLLRTAYGGILHLRLDRITEEDLQTAISDYAQTHSPKSTRNMSGLMSAVLKAYAPGLSFRPTLPQKKKTGISIPSSADINRLLAACAGKQLETALRLAAMLGLRRSEISALQWSDLDEKRKTISINKAMVLTDDGTWHIKPPKSAAGQRVLAVPAPLLEHLLSLERYGDSIVNLHPNAISGRYNRLRQKLGMSWRFHDLRHYYASLMLALGVPDKYAMQRMGHETDTMLKSVYQHLMDDKSAEIDNSIEAKLSALFDA